MPRLARTHIAQLYLPQFEQFGLRLEADGGATFAQASNEVASGSAWVMPIDANCLVMEHSVTPMHDMCLLEQTAHPYACVSEMGAATLSCMPDNGIVPGWVSQRGGQMAAGNVCTFVQSSLHSQYSPLKAGVTYYSRSVLFLEGFFDELERQWPGEFAGLFGAFDTAWPEEARDTIIRALRQLSYGRARRPGASLHARSVVETMVADLACAHAARWRAQATQGSRASARMAAQAVALVERALDRGDCLGVDEVAAQLYVSRSKLCAVFKQETGEGLAAYTRRRRMERACELLAGDALSVAQVAARLGYPRQSAFSQAFKQACGMSPTQWREGLRA